MHVCMWEGHGLLLSVREYACVHVRRAWYIFQCEGICICACEKSMAYFSVWRNMYACMWEEHGIFFSVRENACVHVRRAWYIFQCEGICMCACEKGMVFFSVWGNMHVCMWEGHGLSLSMRVHACVHVRRAWNMAQRALNADMWWYSHLKVPFLFSLNWGSKGWWSWLLSVRVSACRHLRRAGFSHEPSKVC